MEDELAKEHQERQKKKKTQRIVLLIVLGFFILAVVMFSTTDYNMFSYDQTLVLSAKAVNLTCPQTIDEVTRLDSVAAKPGRRYFYYYTLLNMERDTAYQEFMCDQLEENLKSNLKKENTGIEEFGKNGVILNFVFSDKNADSLCNVILRPEEYSEIESTN